MFDLRKHTWVALLAVVAVCTIMVTAFFVHGTTSTSKEKVNPRVNTLSDDVETISSQYLITPPFYPNNAYKTTRIFLIKAVLENYDFSSKSGSEDDIGFTVPDGTNLFTVNGTIRNDYNEQEILRLSQEGVSTCRIGLDIYLYDSQGNFVNTLNRGNPFRGCSELNLRSGEESRFFVAFMPADNDIVYFKIYVSYLDPIPLF